MRISNGARARQEGASDRRPSRHRGDPGLGVRFAAIDGRDDCGVRLRGGAQSTRGLRKA